MPPKKKSRISTTTSPAATPLNAKSPAVPETHSRSPSAEVEAAVSNDPWTDEEEIGLFKGSIKWKPTGIHKHFYILSSRQHSLSNGYIHPSAPHTRIPGIWAKLSTSYDLEALDEREDNHSSLLPSLTPSPASSPADGEDEEEESEDEGDAKKGGRDFESPEDEFGEAMWKARFKTEEEEEGSQSPIEVPELALGPDEPPVRFTPSFEIAPSEADTPTPSRRGRGGRGRGRGGRGRGAAEAARRRSSRVPESVATEEEEEQSEEESEEEESEEEEEEESDEGTPASRRRSGRGRGGTRGTRGKRGRGRR